MKSYAILAAVVLALPTTDGLSQIPEPVSRAGQCFIGSSAFMLFNALPVSPSFYQLNFGHWLTNRDVISLEAITWEYVAPLGIPWGPSYGSPDEKYPGSVKEYGIGLAYQRFLWNDLYTAIHALPLKQKYMDEAGQLIQNGFQLFMTFRVGYHIRILRDRFFVEPSIAATHWPINTRVPDEFASMERKWPNYFLFEPGLHLGVKF